MDDLHGLDWAWWQPSQSQLLALDCNFACRYLSYDGGKNLDKDEADELAQWGIWSVVVWEATADRATRGRNTGILDASEALGQARACGMPESRPIYFAVDFDATAPDQVRDYFEGVASVMGVSRTGVYGGVRVMKWLADAGLATWFWQTYAWSGGAWYLGNHIEQYSNLQKYDHNRAKQDDYGQWMPGKEPDVGLSNADKIEIAELVATYVWAKDNFIDSPASQQAADAAAGRVVNTHWKGESYMTGLWSQNEVIMSKLDELKTLIQTGGGQAAADAKAIVDEIAVRLVDEAPPPA